MKKNKRKTKTSFLIIRAIIRLIDRKLITPVTKFILYLTDKLGKRTDKFEKWLVKKNTILFLSLLLSITAFLAIGNKSITLVDSYAEVLYNQKVDVIYNTEKYVVSGIPETVDVTLIGKKIDIYLAKQLSKGTVTVDLSDLKEGTHKVTLNYESIVDSIEYKLDPSTVNVVISSKVSSTKAAIIDTINKESLDTRLSVSNVSIDKTEIIIKGSDDTIKDVANIRALVDIQRLVDPEVGIVELDDVPLIAYNKDGKVVDVEMVPSKVTATITIDSPHKEIPIKIIPSGEVQFGKAISSITSTDTKVIIYGETDVIDKIEYLPVIVDIKNMNSNKQFTVSLESPDGVRDLSIKSTKVSVTLGEEVSKEIKNVMIETTNLDSNYKVNAIGSGSTETTVIVKGTKEVLENIDESKIKAVVDLSGYTEGDYEVNITVTGDDVKARYQSKTTKIKVRISKK